MRNVGREKVIFKKKVHLFLFIFFMLRLLSCNLLSTRPGNEIALNLGIRLRECWSGFACIVELNVP